MNSGDGIVRSRELPSVSRLLVIGVSGVCGTGHGKAWFVSACEDVCMVLEDKASVCSSGYEMGFYCVFLRIFVVLCVGLLFTDQMRSIRI